MPLPESILSERIGVHPESSFDEFGEIAPITWTCSCGAKLRLENYVVVEDPLFGESIGGEWFPRIISEGYVAVSHERRAEFLAQHSSCPNFWADDDQDDDAPVLLNGRPLERVEF